jgi:hypothetical protein
MTPWQKSVIIVLAIASGACESFGTWTVWKSFKSTASVASDIKKKLENDSIVQLAESKDVGRSLAMGNPRNVDLEVNNLRSAHREYLGHVTGQLEWNSNTAWGLRAFFASVVFGLLAAVLAVVW